MKAVRSRADGLRECVNTVIVLELKRGFVKAVGIRAGRLRECVNTEFV